MRLWNVLVRAQKCVEVEAATEDEAIDKVLEKLRDPETNFGYYAEVLWAEEVTE